MRSSLRPLMIFALIGTAAAVPAFAQSGATSAPVSQYAACNAKPTQADTDAAHGAYTAGKGSFDEADYTTAINYFKDAYRRDCTKNELLVIIARAYELQGNRREAVHALETYLERVPNAADAEVQKRHIANLQREIADAASAAAAAASAAASAAPPPTASAAPTASASASAAPTSAPPPPEPASGSHTIAPWVLVGVGGAGIIVGGILYGVGSGQISSAESTCGGSQHVCPPTSAGSNAQSQGNSGRSSETIGVAVGGIGAAALVGGLIWHFVERTGPEKTAHPVVVPQVGPGYAGVGVGGRF